MTSRSTAVFIVGAIIFSGTGTAHRDADIAQPPADSLRIALPKKTPAVERLVIDKREKTTMTSDSPKTAPVENRGGHAAGSDRRSNTTLLHLCDRPASLVFRNLLSLAEPDGRVVASLATYGVGMSARPIGAFVLGHWATHTGQERARCSACS